MGPSGTGNHGGDQSTNTNFPLNVEDLPIAVKYRFTQIIHTSLQKG